MLSHSLLLAAPLLLTGAPAAARAGGDLTQAAYVWQLARSAALDEAVAAHGDAFDELVVLGAEVRRTGAGYEVQRARTLAMPLGDRPVVVAIRIGPVPLDEDLSRIALRLAEDAAVAHELHGLQIDYDCPSGALAGYARWLTELRRALPSPLALSITGLPTWLGRGELRDVLAAVDGWVLQVHGLEPPAHVDDPVALVDPAAALEDIERAARFDVPFQVALPTYGYALTFDAAGKLAGVVAERDLSPLPPGARQRTVLADAPAMSALVARLTADRPAHLRGVAWYRLPLPGDALAWTWPTLAAVMAGDDVAPRLEVVLRPQPDDPELVEVLLRSRGTADAPVPRRLRIASSSLAADGQGGFTLAAREPTRVVLEARALRAYLRAGEERVVGWLRLPAGAAAPREVTVDG
ncbi:MAG: DUF3142 domain-containing protein [Polyangiaceae bacterium]